MHDVHLHRVQTTS